MGIYLNDVGLEDITLHQKWMKSLVHALPCQALNYCEFFAGQANVWRAVSQVYPAARVDLDYSDPTYVEKMNPMDFLSCPGFASLDFNHYIYKFQCLMQI